MSDSPVMVSEAASYPLIGGPWDGTKVKTLVAKLYASEDRSAGYYLLVVENAQYVYLWREGGAQR